MTPIERRALSRDITRLANASVAEALCLEPLPGDRCALIGVTGPPGVGKSSLIARVASARVAERGSLAILAIDPTSPISGGAILGDRIRMAELVDDQRIFIRSLATRGNRDGLARNLPLIIDHMVRSGFAEVILETVGVGQVEYAVRDMVDTMLLVLSPGAGDQIQAMKSGIVETPDIFVINKADLAGADQVGAEIKAILHLRPARPGGWRPVVIKVSAERATGLDDLDAAISAHQAWLARQDVRSDLDWRREILRALVARRAEDVLPSLTADAMRGSLGQAFVELLTAMRADNGGADG